MDRSIGALFRACFVETAPFGRTSCLTPGPLSQRQPATVAFFRGEIYTCLYLSGLYSAPQHSSPHSSNPSMLMLAPTRRASSGAVCALLLCSCSGDSPTNMGEGSGQNPPVTPKAASLTVTPDSLLLFVGGDTARFTAAIKDQNGNPMTGLSITWASSDTMVAKVDGGGLVTSIKAGQATITAAVEALKAERRAIIKLQRNARCVVPTGFPTRGGVGSTPKFTEEFLLDSLRATHNEVQGAIVDLRGNGDPDILVFSNNRSPDSVGGFRNSIQVWRNDGSGRFSDATRAVLGSDSVPVDGALSPRVIDMNGDGRQDVFAAQTGWDYPPGPGGPDLLLIQQGDGGLKDIAPTALHPYESRGSGAFTHSGAAADIDCDGDVDLYQGNINHAVGPHLQVNGGGLTFQAEERQRLPEFVWSLEKRYTASEFCDIDRDGDVDIALGGFDGSRDRLLINDGFGRFSPAPESALPPSPLSRNVTVEIRCADVDLDGWNDLLVASNDDYVQARIAYWHNKQTGSFEDLTSTHIPQAWPSFSPGTAWVDELQVVDMNSDGWPDLVGSGTCIGTIFINQGDGRFAQQTNLMPARSVCNRASDSIHLLFPLDANRDGRMDLLILRGWERHTLDSSRGTFEIGVSSILRNTR